MLSQDQSKKMSNRGGLPIKNIVTAIFILLSVYLVYIYSVSQNRLHDAEMTGSRYKREAEEKVNEIQGLISAKDDFQERCEDEKRELNNRLKSINQKHSMVQSQNTELEADLMKLKQDMDNLRAEHMQTESQHAQEYQTLKQSKETEISDLSGQLEQLKQTNEDLQNKITTLQGVVQNNEVEMQRALQMIGNLQNVKKDLMEKNAQLQLLQFQREKQLQLQQQNEANAMEAKALQEEHKQMNENPNPAAAAAQIPQQDNSNVNVMNQGREAQPAQNNAAAPIDSGNIFNQGEGSKSDSDKDQAAKIDQLNAMNQAKPPGLNEAANNFQESAKEEEKKEDVEEEHRPDVNPNDLQKAQILEPLKQDGGEVDREDHVNLREVEEQREREEMEHKDPLNLGQMQQPLGGQAVEDNNDKNQGQQQAPVLFDEKDENQAANEGQEQNKAVNPVAP